jgi:tRNA threonylcarbamoyladenosine biosynthesis protein TsaE
MKTLSRIPTATAMVAFGQALAKTLRGGEVLLLSGPLGSGKTTLMQGLAKGLGVRKRVASPTYVIVQSFACKQGKIRALTHVDLYRLTPHEVHGLGLGELLGQPGRVVAIEWPARLGRRKLNGRIIRLTLRHHPTAGRIVTVKRER